MYGFYINWKAPAQVNDVLWDMSRPLVDDCTLQFYTFDSNEGRDTFWHSSAHILGEVGSLRNTFHLSAAGCMLKM
jgi:threonyl-tRNA synthetase